MKIAIISITTNGRKVAEKIHRGLSDNPTIIQTDLYENNVKKTLKNIYNDYDCIIGVMATGIVIRTICSLLKSKADDPAILVVDEKGEHVISLLSGHLGGANHYARIVSLVLDADPVITTATDVSGNMGVDTLARTYWLGLENLHAVKIINRAIVEGQNAELYLPTRYDFLKEDEMAQNSYNFHYWDENHLRVDFEEVSLTLNPLPMVAGVGSRRGVSSQQVLNGLELAMSHLGIPVDRLDVIATGEMKKDEEGIMEAAWSLGIPVEIIPIKELEIFRHPHVKTSLLVEKKFGLVGVAEPSALITAGDNPKLILRKTSFNGVSVAIAVSESLNKIL
ncbi:MAG TPA: cobalt-precorrin 5A hydrolase [Methanobacteriaceae archaeon]|nr:cobalt-precorrin 5A hydrolase [Methanobacteriaceae archaeon]